MKQLVRFAVVPLGLAVLLGGSVAFATPEYTDQIGLQCTECHDKAGSKRLTDKGLYFETTGSLDGFDALSDTFSKCTSCHVRKPGSRRLTKQGKSFASIVDGMDELREWLKNRHPATDKEGGGMDGASLSSHAPLIAGH